MQPPKGTRDFLPEKAEKLQKIVSILRSVFEKYGFKPLYTPAFENFELLSAKGGLGEAVKDEIYYFRDKGNRELGLRFDLTMPLARVAASNPNMQKPFKRYCIDRVWRYDNPQAMRYREFWQGDIDIIGSKSLLADAECLAAAVECIEALGFKDFYIRLNNRKLLQAIIDIYAKEKSKDAMRIIDKLDKIGREGVAKELSSIGIDGERLVSAVTVSGENKAILERLKGRFGENEGLKEIEKLLSYAKTFGIEKRLKIDVSLARGLEYYTGIVFEVFAGAKVSCGAGGRYDNLIKNISGIDTPATGISFGIDRLLEILESKKSAQKNSYERVFVADIDLKKDSIKIASDIRKAGIPCELDIMGRKFGKQLEYASSAGIRYVVIVGKEELKKKSVKLKDMKSGKEKLVKLSALQKIIKNILLK